jgi:mannose-6-phosphate isomerase-like protein (cupin superfamily)
MDEQRTWGRMEVLGAAADHKVTRVTVNPGTQLSTHRHARRSEHWHVVSGEASVEVDGQEVTLGPGDSVNIRCGAAHRLRNTGADRVVFIEILRGEHSAEDDIELLP